MKQKRFVLLDRDGTIIVEKNYLSDPDHLELLPGAGDALKILKKLDLGLVIITNQSGIGRKYFDLSTLNKIHQKLAGLLLLNGVILDDIYFCPHLPEDNCFCRKPKTALVEKAAKEHSFDPALSFIIGDNRGDIELGKNVGATTILVKTGHGAKIAEEKLVTPDYIVDDLVTAVGVIRKEILKSSP